MVPHAPQLAPLLRRSTHCDPHRLNPMVHAMPHPATASQTAVPLIGGDGHGVQLEPQCDTSPFETHCPPHRWNPVRHVNPHTPPEHIALDPGGVGHATHASPQCIGSVALAQLEPQRWLPVPHD
jgi:hypothetical protein